MTVLSRSKKAASTRPALRGGRLGGASPGARATVPGAQLAPSARTSLRIPAPARGGSHARHLLVGEGRCRHHRRGRRPRHHRSPASTPSTAGPSSSTSPGTPRPRSACPIPATRGSPAGRRRGPTSPPMPWPGSSWRSGRRLALLPRARAPPGPAARARGAGPPAGGRDPPRGRRRRGRGPRQPDPPARRRGHPVAPRHPGLLPRAPPGHRPADPTVGHRAAPRGRAHAGSRATSSTWSARRSWPTSRSTRPSPGPSTPASSSSAPPGPGRVPSGAAA